jgi:hypothetical protein
MVPSHSFRVNTWPPRRTHGRRSCQTFNRFSPAAPCSLLLTMHSAPAPQELPEDLLLAKHVLVRRDGHVPPLAAAYDGPFLVLERSLRFFKLQIGDRIDTVSTFRLKPCTSPPDVTVAQPPKRGRPAAAAAAPPPEVVPPPAQTTSPQRAQRRRRVTFRCPVLTLPSSPTQRLHPSGRPARSAGPPRRYMVSRVRVWGGGSCGEMTFTDSSQLCRPIYFIQI